ncbi:MAG TPA: M48 family metallopeptidase [Syntrophales bacterium]
MIQLNALFAGFIVLFAAAALTRYVLARMNIAHLREHGHIVPETFREEIDSATLARMRDYTVESSRFQSLESLADDALLLAVLAGGVLPWLCGAIESWNFHAVWSGTLFFGILYAVSVLLDIPFSLYSTFVIEKKYGFSTITPQLWLIDLVKSVAVSVILMALLFIPFFALVHWLPRSWWFAAWVFFALFQMLMIWLYPLVIAPLFNKYVPVKDEALRDRILAMAEKAGLRAEGIFEVDAGRRSRHSNAYFTGLGRSKRIVLFDTLIATHSHDEIVAVLAHEIGHWKLRHVLKQLILMEVVALAGFYLVFRLIGWPLLYETFGFAGPLPYAGLLLAAIVLKPAAFFFTPIGAAISRKYEKDADRYVLGLVGSTRYLAQALKRLAKENLANLHPHPTYVAFYYSHPPLAQRVERLQAMDGEEVVKVRG